MPLGGLAMPDKNPAPAGRPLESLVTIDPESLPLGTNPHFAFHYLDISAAANGRLTLPSETIEYRAAPSRARRVIRSGDVLMATVRPNLKAFAYCSLPSGNFVASTGFAVLRPINGTDPHFVLSSILSDDVTRQIDRYVVGSNYPAINSSDVRRLQIPDFSPAAQRRIGEIIATLDEAIEQTEALVAKTQQIKAGLMHDLFTRGVAPDGELRPPRKEAPKLYKDSPLGWIPKEWEIVRCGDSFDVQLGKMMSPAATAGPNQRPYLRNQNVYWDYLDLSDVATMHFSSDDMLKYRLKRGDLLACEGRFIGRCAIWRDEIDECYYQKALHRLRAVDDRTTTEYMAFFMSLRFEMDRGFVEKMTHESTIPHLPLEKLLTLPTLMPPRDEQDVIVSSIRSLIARIQNDEEQLNKLRHLKLALMHDLLTGRVRVPITDAPKVAAHV
jgi:type I restriction enzyme, S subunit